MPGDGISRASGAPSTIVIDGETLKLAPLTLRDWGAVENHVLRLRKKAKLQTAYDLKEVLPDAEWQAEWAAAKEAADRIAKIPEAELMGLPAVADTAGKTVRPAVPGWVDSLEGMAFTLWLMLDKYYPKRFTPEGLLDRLAEMGTLDAADVRTGRDQAAALDTASKNLTGPSVDSAAGKAEAASGGGAAGSMAAGGISSGN